MFIVKNEGVSNLENRLKQIISLTDEIKILVGFFYFSGLNVIYYGEEAKNLSRNERMEKFINPLKTAFNMDYFIDQLVYKLYNLTDEEIERIERKIKN